jgi:23S rRNA (pseudouridine1915-N3)-methyltransferase
VTLTVAWIGKTKAPAIQSLTEEYLGRLRHYGAVEGVALKDEAALLRLCRNHGRSRRCRLVLIDPRGKQLSSEEWARFLREQQERSPWPLLFAVGPANGFSNEIRQRAEACLSLGKLTLPHELARIVVLEQLYRALTILEGHPYHLGH